MTAAPKPAAPALDPKAPDGDGKIYLGRSFIGAGKAQRAKDEFLTLRLANRHGLVTGATGTGKTVTLQVLAEGFARAGVPVFAADIKGDLSGIAEPGTEKDFLLARAKEVGIDYQPDSFPVIFWDMFGAQGHPVRATISEMGPLLLSRLMGLNDTQEGVLNIAFRVADEQGLLLLDLKDLRALLAFVAENAATLGTQYGNVAPQTVGAIQRQLLVLENQGADKFFGEPALNIADLMRVDRSGYGTVSILAADKLMGAPRLYACFLLWLLSEMFEQLPEVGDPEKPKLVFFFDEAHLLFDEAPKVLLDKVDQKAVRAAAETFRPNPDLETAKVIMELGKGEALVSMLEGNGVPSMVERTLIRPPSARVGPITEAERAAIMAKSPVGHVYDQSVDRESAFEKLQQRAEQKMQPPAEASAGGGGLLGGILDSVLGTGTPAPAPGGAKGTPRASTRMSTTEVVVRQVARTVATQVGTQLTRAILRGILGNIKR